jgi:hypothetical protein
MRTLPYTVGTLYQLGLTTLTIAPEGDPVTELTKLHSVAYQKMKLAK